MSSEGKKDEMKGRAKKAVGEVTGDGELKREGQTDKVAGKAKQAVEKARKKLEK